MLEPSSPGVQSFLAKVTQYKQRTCCGLSFLSVFNKSSDALLKAEPCITAICFCFVT